MIYFKSYSVALKLQELFHNSITFLIKQFSHPTFYSFQHPCSVRPVSGAVTKVQFRYRHPSRNIFTETETFFFLYIFKFSNVFPLHLAGNISIYKLENEPKSSKET